MQYSVEDSGSPTSLTMHVGVRLPAVNLRGSVTDSPALKAALESVPGVVSVRAHAYLIEAELSPLFDRGSIILALAAVAAGVADDLIVQGVGLGTVRPGTGGDEEGAPIEPGSTVRLATGGPKMTLGVFVAAPEGVLGSGLWARCYWGPAPADPLGRFLIEDFPVAALVAA